MNRFDRVTSILLLLQTRSVVTARFLADHFDVTLRTIYRDIRTLETAGVPIGAEAGVGYFLEAGYALPPICFTLDEAAALLLGEKLLKSRLDDASLADFQSALHKVRAVIDRSDNDFLSALDSDTAVLPGGEPFPLSDNATPTPPDAETRVRGDGDDRWLRECRAAVIHRHVVSITYRTPTQTTPTTRDIEPIGLFYYSSHWHLIAWCRVREAYRDFRLDRVDTFVAQAEQFARRSRLTLQQYLDQQPSRDGLLDVELVFDSASARFVGEQRYSFGFVDEREHAEGVQMRFLTHLPDYMARWLLQFADGVRVVRGDPLKAEIKRLSARAASHWDGL